MAHDASVLVISSSPEFPSICDLVPTARRKPALRSGTNAIPIPDDAQSTFTSAATVWRTSILPQPGESDSQTGLSTKATLPPQVGVVSQITNEGLGRAGTQSQAASAAGSRENGPTDPPNPTVSVKKSRKPRSKKEPTRAQTTLPPGKVTKPSAKGTHSKKKVETVSKHFPPPVPARAVQAELSSCLLEGEAVILEPAMKRRTDSWTPPRPHEQIPSFRGSPVHNEPASSTNVATDDVFKTLQDTYGLAATSEPTINPTIEPTVHGGQADVFGKRKLIDMVALAGNKEMVPEVSPSKPGVVKKKPRTITELATAAYRVAKEEDATGTKSQQESVPSCPPTSVDQPTDPIKSATANKVSKSKASKMPRVPKVPKLPKKKPQPPKPVSKQDFVFGTASQLAAEDDPALLRALHEAMRDLTPSKTGLAMRHGRPRSELWMAGARYGDGDLLDTEVLDLTGSSPSRSTPSGSPSRQAPVESPTSDAALHIATPPSAEWPDPVPSPALPSAPAISLCDESSPAVEVCQQMPPPVPELEPPPSNQEQHQLLLSQSNSPQHKGPAALSLPNYELYTDARLATEVASFGFKACWESQGKPPPGTLGSFQAASPPRPRGRPRKNPVAAEPDDVQVVAAKPGRKKKSAASGAESRPGKNSTASPMPGASPSKRGRKRSVSLQPTDTEAPLAEKKTRGKPKKDTTSASATRITTSRRTTSPKRTKSPNKQPTTPKYRKGSSTDIIEIPDSDLDDEATDCASSSSSIGDVELFSSPGSQAGIDISLTEDTETSLLGGIRTSDEDSRFQSITRAIQSAPRSTDPSKPSWHEKMLMYDPIIIEDLAAWLNAGQLDRVGFDEEVTPWEVKEWCASKSVHEDGPAYRLAAIRETFEESGILLAKRAGQTREQGGLLQLSDDVREDGRKKVHANEVRFEEWVREQGGEPDVDNLIPFTRWITPHGPPKRFTTQMYLYMLPLSSTSTTTTGSGLVQQQTRELVIPAPTHDGGVEHTAAAFDHASTWLARARAGEIILFPPQFYLLHLVSAFLDSAAPTSSPSSQQDHHHQTARTSLLNFLAHTPTSSSSPFTSTTTNHPTASISWGQKVISPAVLFMRSRDGRVVLGLDKPGPELRGSDPSAKGGDMERVVLVKFQELREAETDG
ncbi:uncharacterized protein C8A04DRAFT_36998 [Dichotomopilus funicola]|uniref:Structure-specific endonuclease subunit SLX4 n=1 Tax=Dichotomopilus funicola TaxID=1934379 RepID=A0AAN6ZLS0_9PEZI|nr:hypothetical protein C8A04DRAFT_36998 [Dichotomopilus funicola]